jgi:hypothetical protein
MTPTQLFWTFWIVVGMITSVLGLLLMFLLAGLMRSNTWSLADALSEEAAYQPNPLPAGTKPIMVASSSRLIAFLGLVVILCLYLGIGYAYIWDRFFKPDAAINMKNLLAFLFGGATMFAPYLVNVLSTAFSSYTTSQQSSSGQSPQT